MEAAGERVLQRLRDELKKHDTSLRSLYGDGWSIGPLEDREFRVLSAVSQLGEGSATEVLRIVENWAAGFTFVNVHLLLDGLQRREFVTSRKGDPAQFFQVTEEGARALARARVEEKKLIAQENDLRGPCPERLM